MVMAQQNKGTREAFTHHMICFVVSSALRCGPGEIIKEGDSDMHNLPRHKGLLGNLNELHQRAHRRTNKGATATLKTLFGPEAFCFQLTTCFCVNGNLIGL